MISVAMERKSDSLISLAHRTRSKLYFYKDKCECKKSLDTANQLSKKSYSNRIHEDNFLSELIFEMHNNPNCDWEKVYDSSNTVKNTSFRNSFYKSYIRSYLLLGTSKIKSACKKNDLLDAKKIIQQGIDASIRFGIPAHIWQFYNLMGIADTKLGYSENHLLQVFETMFSMLANQNLLYIGNIDFCYSNLMAISNFGFFLQNNISETVFNSRMSRVTHTGYLQFCDYNCACSQCGCICSTNNAYLKEQYKNARDKQLLFVKNRPADLLCDEETGYFFALS